MEAVGITAAEIARWLNLVLQSWRTEEDAFRKSRKEVQNLKLDEDWLSHIGGSRMKREEKL